jgi:hypothetical protein
MWPKALISVSPNSECCVTKKKYVQSEHGCMFSRWRGVLHSWTLLLCTCHMKWHSKYNTVHFDLWTFAGDVTTTFLLTPSTKIMLTWIMLMLTLYTTSVSKLICLKKCKNP